MKPGEKFAFGPFQLDAKARRLTRDGEPVAMTGRHFDLLHCLVSRAGQVLSKDALIEAAWPDVAVTDNSLEQAISTVRRALTPPAGHPYIETQSRRGYRFVAAVTRLELRETDEALDALLAPHRAWLEGRAALETLEREQTGLARVAFEEVLAQVPDQASAHVGLANACAMQFEMTRAEAAPDRAALEQALHHAREACRLDAQYGEAWATLGFVLDRTGRHDDALAASRRAVSLEPDNWRHHLRLAYASWGEERLREARRTLSILPGCPLAHWVAASVFVARQTMPEAERELHAGISAQADALVGTLSGSPGGPASGLTHERSGGPLPPSGRFSGIALHWLGGLIHLSHGEDEEARDAFERELSHEGSGHLYSRECCANTWYAIGALEFRRGRRDAALHAFREALRRLPRHPMATLGVAAMLGASAVPEKSPTEAIGESLSGVDQAIMRAAWLVLSGGDAAQAAPVVDRALADAPAGSAGWLPPVELLLHVSGNPSVWAPALSRLRNRAA